MAEEVVLKGINAKLGALLAISVDQYLRETGVARPKRRSIDRLLADAGLGAKEISALLGKTERAVHLVLASEKAKGPGKKVEAAAVAEEEEA